MSTTTATKLGIAAITAGLLLSACKPAPTSTSLVAEARVLQQKGDHTGALIQLKNAAVNDPANAEARMALAEAYNRLGDGSSSEKEVRKAMSLGLPAERTLPELLLAQLLQAQFQKVVDATNGPEYAGNAKITSQRGVALYQLGKHDAAIEAFERALKLEPREPVALMGLANIALARKDVPATKAYVDRAIALNPNDIDVVIFKGDFERSNGNNAGALAAYNHAIALDPRNASGYLKSVYVHVAERRFAEAKAAVISARKIAPKNINVMYASALIAFTEQQYPQSLEALQQVLRLAPDHWPAVLLAGAVQFNLKSMPQAEQHLKRYVKQFPDSAYARKLLIATLIAAGNPKEAIATMQPVVEGSTDTQLLGLAGQAYLDNHDYANAAATFERASKLDPGKALLRTSLAFSKLQEGDQTRAMTELELATTLEVGSPDASTALAVTALRIGQYDKALAALQRVFKLSPNDPLPHNLAGLAYLGKQERATARASFDKALALKADFFPAVDSLARMDLEDKQPDQARKRYEAFVQKFPTNVDGLTALGALAVAQGQPAAATPLLERANAAAPTAEGPAIFLATHYRAIGETGKALSLMRKLQVAHPENTELLDLLGQLQLANGDKGGAMETFNRLAQVAPQSVTAHLRLATAHDAMNNLPSAVSSYKRALALEPGLLDAQLALAGVYLRQNLPHEALNLARQMQKHHPKLPVGYVSEGDVLMLQRKPAAAIPLYEKAFALGNNAELLLKLVQALNVGERAKDADARIARWRASKPDDIKVPSYLAAQYVSRNEWPAAITEYEAILKKQPQHAPSLNNLATAYEAVKDPRALPTAEKALLAAPQSPEVLDTLGTMLAERGQMQRGVALLQDATVKAPGRADIRYHLLRAMVKAKDLDGARKELVVLSTKHPDFPRLDEARALLR